MSEIVDVRAFEVLDSRGNPTVMAEVTLDDDSVGVLVRRRVRAPVHGKPWSSGMATPPATSARAC